MLEEEGQVDFELFTMVGSPTFLRGIEEPEKTLYLVLGVEKDFNPSDVEILKDFYEKGGKLIIADDFGYANTFSQEFDVHFYGRTLWDTFYKYNYSYPLIYGQLDFTDYLLITDKPTGLHILPDQNNITILANSSVDSFIDINDNGMIDKYDVPGPIPVVAQYQEPDHQGTIVFISDPDIFTDDIIEKGGDLNISLWNNKQFLRDLIVNKLLPTGGKVIFDEGRHEQTKQITPVFRTLETITILTSNFKEMALFLVGLTLIMAMIIVKAKDKGDWIHKYNVGYIKRRADLPKGRYEIRDRLRAVVLMKLRIKHSLTRDDLRAMNSTQIASMVKDHEINELVLNDNRDFSDIESEKLVEKLKRWGK
jgi:hypothetical protein